MRHVSAADPLDVAFGAIRDLEPTEAEIAAVLKRAPRRGRMGFRTPRLIIVVAVLAVGVGAGAAAAVNTFSAATGTYMRAGERNAQATGTGEAIALGARDEVSVGVELTRDIPFAPGYAFWRAGTIAFQTTLDGGAPLGHAIPVKPATVLPSVRSRPQACPRPIGKQISPRPARPVSNRS